MDERETGPDQDEVGGPDLQAPPGEEGKPEISEYSQKGYLYLKENRIAEGEECFRRILELEPENNYALVGLGDAARKRGDFVRAASHYQKCLDLHPDNNYALFGLADSLKSRNQYGKAIEIWERYLVQDEKNVTVLTRVADSYRKMRNFSRSRDLYQQVLALERDNPYALVGLGHLYYDFKEYEKALSYWERMMENRDGDVDIRILTSIGNCHRKLKTFQKGLAVFSRALELDPVNFYALFGMADCCRGLNRHRESLEYWNRILRLDPENKVILTRAGDACRALGDFAEAEAFYRRALNIEFDAFAILGLALINKQQGKYSEALRSLESLLKSDPRNPRIYGDIADCHLRLGRKDLALQVLAEFHRQGLRSAYASELYERLRGGH